MGKGVRASSIGLLSLALVGCGLKDPSPFDPRSLMRTEREGAVDARPLYMPPQPTTLEDITTSGPATNEAASQPSGRRRVGLKPLSRATTGPALSEHPTIRLSLQEIIHRAVVNSHEVRVAGYDAAVSKTRILEAQAHFDPVAFAQTKYQDQKILSPTQSGSTNINPFSPQTFRTFDMQVGMRQNLPSGGQVELHYDIQRIQTSPTGSPTNPYNVNDLALQITQPLLREFGYDVNWARVSIARNDYRVSILDFRKALEENLAELERNYWQTAEAEQEVLIQQDLLRQSLETYRILVEQSRGGSIADVQTKQARASIETRQTVLIRAKSKILNLSDNIKRRMNDPEFPVAGAVTILAASLPTEVLVHFDLEDQINTALANRFELGQQILRLKSADIATDVAKNNLLPKLSLTGTVDVQGPGRNIGYAFQNQGRSDFIGASIGFELEWPLGNREARSIYRRSMLQRLQAIEQYRFLIESITEDVKTAWIEVETTWQEIAGRRRATIAQADELEGYERKRDLGAALDPNFVNLILDAQERLAEAKKEERVAVAGYNLALAGLERAKGTLLRYNNIVMEEDKFISTEK